MTSKLFAIPPLAAALTLGGCVAPMALGPVNGYYCPVEHSDPRGKLELDVALDLSGGKPQWSGAWVRQSGSIEIEAIWVGDPVADVADGQQVNINVARTRHLGWRTSNVTVQFRRQGEPAPALIAPVTGYDFHYYGTGVDVGDLRKAALGGQLEVVVVDRKGKLLGQGQIDMAVFDEGRAMVAEARAEIEAMRADYRNRCRVTREDVPGAPSIVIT